MNHTDNQGRDDREQLPDCSGIVIGVIVGLVIWCLAVDVYFAIKG